MDNSLSNTADDISSVMANLQYDAMIYIRWFKNNGMDVNPVKFQFMIGSNQALEQQKLRIDENTEILSENHVKHLGVTIDNKLNFSQHVSICCSKAARQLNALGRISKQLDQETRKVIFQSFVYSNLNYCPLVWHFCGKTNYNKIKKIHERALKIVYNDYESPYQDLLDKAGTTTVLISRLKTLLVEVFKCIKGLNPHFLNAMFECKTLPYSLRDSCKIMQPKRKSTTYGIRSFTFIGAKLWNDLPSHFKDLCDMDVAEFKHLLNNWSGPCDTDYFKSYM